ncbi:MAG: PEP-CTERM sorting domain-containing protein [Desulfobacteraceae bacterium]
MYYDFMKCFKVFLCSFLCFFALAVPGFSSVITYNDVKSFNFCDSYGAEGPILKLFLGDTFTYSHSLPSDFQVPYDEVYSATLSITGYLIDENDNVYIGDENFGELNEGGTISYKWVFAGFKKYGFIKVRVWERVLEDNPSVTSFDVASVFNVWESGKFFDVSIKNDSAWNFFDFGFVISQSVFTLEYENKVAAHAPEPSTMILFGLGLLGFGVFAGKRFRKN